MRYQTLAVGILAGPGLCAPALEAQQHEHAGVADMNIAPRQQQEHLVRRSPQRSLRSGGKTAPKSTTFARAAAAAVVPTSKASSSPAAVVSYITLTTVVTVVSTQATTQPSGVAAATNHAPPDWMLAYSSSRAANPPASLPSSTPQVASSNGGGFFSNWFGGGSKSTSSPPPTQAQQAGTSWSSTTSTSGTQQGSSGGYQPPGWMSLVGGLLFGGGGSGSSAQVANEPAQAKPTWAGILGELGGLAFSGISNSNNDGGDDSDRPSLSDLIAASGGRGGGGGGWRGSNNRDDGDDDGDGHRAEYGAYSWPSPNEVPDVLLPNGSVSTTITFKQWKPKLRDPRAGPTFQIILSGVPDVQDDSDSIEPDVDIYDIDLFNTDARTIANIKRLGKTVVCYFSAGTYEADRPDSRSFNFTDVGLPLSQWPRERWVHLPSPRIREIMRKRIALAHAKGCDAIDPDNVDGYQTSLGGGFFPRLTSADTVDFVRFLSNEAALHGMAMGLKNALDILPAVTSHVHFAVNEECAKMRECGRYNTFLKEHKKPVFHIEYPPPPKPKPPPPPPPGVNGTVSAVSAAPSDPSKSAMTQVFGSLASSLWKSRDEVEGGGPRVSHADLTKLEPADRERWCVSGSYAGQHPYFSTVLKIMSLDGFVEYCNGAYAVTPTSDGRRSSSSSSRSRNGRNRNNDD